MKKHMVLGPPGTGKTTVMLNLVQELLDQGVAPEEIAFVSFTTKAAHEARNRAVDRFGLDPDRFRWFRTLHSIGYELMGLRDSDVMDTSHWRELSKILGMDLMQRFDPSSGEMTRSGSDAAWLHHHDLARMTCQPFDEYWRHLPEHVRLDQFTRTSSRGGVREFVWFADQIERFKKSHGVSDFNDMLALSLAAPPLPLRYVIIDEAQDLSRLQWRFCRHVFQNAEHIWVAGDDDQSIFRWAGADFDTFRHMTTDDRRVLDKSYRCPRSIWEISNRIISRVGDRYEKTWAPRDERGEVHWSFKGQMMDHLPIDEGNWLLLTRIRGQQPTIKQWLRMNGLPFIVGDRHSVNPTHLHAAQTWTALKQGKRITVSAARALYDFFRSGVHLTRGSKKALDDVKGEPRFCMGDLQSRFGLLATEGEWYDVLVIPPADADYYRRIRRRGESLTSDRIRISTIHAVKGGECDNVAFANDMGMRAHGAMSRRKDAYDDEHRVFYVAATRAKKRLFLHCQGRNAFPLPRYH